MDSNGPSTVVVTVARAPWHEAIGELEPLAKRIVQATLDQASTTAWIKGGEVSLLLSDDREIRSLNADYRARDRATNVLSFPGFDLVKGKAAGTPPPQPALLGDIAMSFERLTAEALEQQKDLVDHFAHLLVHGTLHLLGYDHGDDAEAEVMEGLETAILKTLGFAVPYPLVERADGMSAAT